MKRSYMTTALHTKAVLQTAIEEAKSLLPPAVTRRHWMANAAASPAAWRDVEAWFRAQENQGEKARVLNILTDLSLMAEALACLKTITKEQAESRPPDFRLAKQRRVS